jgi:hypothetical protein
MDRKETVLVTLTIVLAVAALGLAWYAWQLRADERRRSEARVAALSSAIDAVEHASHVRTAPAAVPVAGLFARQESAAGKGTPVIRIAVGVVMGLVLLVAVAMSNRGASPAAPREDGAPQAAAAAPAAAPLELISMRHEREGDTLKVSGLVRNPRNGGRVARVTAVVLAFNRAGAFVKSGSAGLDFTTLDPGDESPFVVTIPGIADVGRYRVSFRTEAGAMRHVDRRAEQMRLAVETASAGTGRL